MMAMLMTLVMMLMMLMINMTGIPQVGYLTTFDDWIFVMYTTLAMCVVLHQIVIVLKRKTTSDPLRGALIRVIETSGRLFFGPLSCVYYLYTFMTPDLGILILYLTCIFVFMVFIGLREWGGLKKSFKLASSDIIEKLNDGARVSHLEIFVMNLVSYRHVSITTKLHQARLTRQKRARRSAAKREIEMESRKRAESLHDSDDDDDDDDDEEEIVSAMHTVGV